MLLHQTPESALLGALDACRVGSWAPTKSCHQVLGPTASARAMRQPSQLTILALPPLRPLALLLFGEATSTPT